MTYHCVCCNLQKIHGAFSKNQHKKKAARKCLECVSTEQKTNQAFEANQRLDLECVSTEQKTNPAFEANQLCEYLHLCAHNNDAHIETVVLKENFTKSNYDYTKKQLDTCVKQLEEQKKMLTLTSEYERKVKKEELNRDIEQLKKVINTLQQQMDNDNATLHTVSELCGMHVELLRDKKQKTTISSLDEKQIEKAGLTEKLNALEQITREKIEAKIAELTSTLTDLVSKHNMLAEEGKKQKRVLDWLIRARVNQQNWIALMDLPNFPKHIPGKLHEFSASILKGEPLNNLHLTVLSEFIMGLTTTTDDYYFNYHQNEGGGCDKKDGCLTSETVKDVLMRVDKPYVLMYLDDHILNEIKKHLCSTMLRYWGGLIKYIKNKRHRQIITITTNLPSVLVDLVLSLL